jgi:hypothetical protein
MVGLANDEPLAAVVRGEHDPTTCLDSETTELILVPPQRQLERREIHK